MRGELPYKILPQPNDTTCGPTCLHSIYQYYGDIMPLEQVIDEVTMLESGGTLAVMLACHALKRGYQATIYTYKMQLFDPSWLLSDRIDLAERLTAQMNFKQDDKLTEATKAYLSFLELGGELRLEDLTASLLRRYVKHRIPILTGLSSTYLYRTPREFGPKCDYDDVRGEPSGHFVVLCGYNKEDRTLQVADPLRPNPVADGQIYKVTSDRVICSILLGVLTYDANLLIIQPSKRTVHNGQRNSYCR